MDYHVFVPSGTGLQYIGVVYGVKNVHAAKDKVKRTFPRLGKKYFLVDSSDFKQVTC